MKKGILFLLTAIAVSIITPTILETNEARSQLITTLVPIAANDTLTNTDTAWVYIVPDATNSKTFSSSASVADNISRSVTIRCTKVSGTVAGSVSLEGSNDATNWELIGSAFTLTNVADQVKTFEMRSSTGNLIFKYYRCVFLCSGTNVHIPKVYLLRRSN